MKKQLDLVKEGHIKFRAPVSALPTLIPEDRSNFRHKLMLGEVEEYLIGARNKDLINIAKELSDILYTVYGTILEHGLQDKMEEIFAEVCNSNMSKDYSEYKFIKGPNYFEADIKKFFSE